MKKRLFALLAFVLLPAAFHAAETPRFRMTATTLQLPPGDSSGTVTVTVLATFADADKHPAGTATLTDETPNATGVSVTVPPVKTTDQPQQTWRFTVTIKNLPKAATQSRTFVLTYAGFREKFDYTVTNVNAVGFAWSVKAAVEWNVATQPILPIAIRVGDVPATNVSVSQVVLISDDKRKETIGNDRFQLCAGFVTGCDEMPASLSPRTPYTLYLRPSGPLPVGVFRGTVSLAATEKTDPETLTLAVYSPRPHGRKLGIFAVTAGVLLSLLIQILIPTLIQVNQEKAAIAVLRLRLETIVAEFSTLPPDFQEAAEEWRNRAKLVATDLSGLATLVRGVVPVPFAQEAAGVETLKTAMERVGAAVSLLQLLQRDGLARIVAASKAFPGHEGKALVAATEIAMTPAETAAGHVKKIVDQFIALASGEEEGELESRAVAPRSAAADVDMFRLHILALSLTAWLLWGTLSVLSGAVLLVFQSPGFGTWLDYVFCLAWGAGITLAGQQAAHLTPGSVATAIGVKIPAAPGK
jgi:hypothetical protein